MPFLLGWAPFPCRLHHGSSSSSWPWENLWKHAVIVCWFLLAGVVSYSRYELLLTVYLDARPGSFCSLALTVKSCSRSLMRFFIARIPKDSMVHSLHSKVDKAVKAARFPDQSYSVSLARLLRVKTARTHRTKKSFHPQVVAYEEKQFRRKDKLKKLCSHKKTKNKKKQRVVTRRKAKR